MTHPATVTWHRGCCPCDMAPSRRWLFLPIWLVVILAVLVGGLYLGYRWPEITATAVLFSLVAVWIGAERLTTRWWY